MVVVVVVVVVVWQTLGRNVVDSLRTRLRGQRLAAPSRIYKTKQKLLPLVLQLGS